MKAINKILSFVLLLIGICAVFYGCREAASRMEDDISLQQSLESVASESDSAETISPEPETTETAPSQPEAAEEPEEPYVSPYAELFETYPDVAAYLIVPGTNIDYPVVWTPENETEYLYKNYDGTDNINGSLLLDTDSCLDPLTTNLIIHGHNMKSGAMFGNMIEDFDTYEDYEQHKYMTLYTDSTERNYEVIAVFRSQVFKKSDTCFKFYKFFQADTEEEFNDFYENIKALALYDTGVTAEFGDHFITLSTCAYHVENGRFVVVAKEIEDTVSEDEN